MKMTPLDMTDCQLTLLAAIIRKINEENGWNIIQPEDWENQYKIPASLGLVHSEVSEALEAFRHDDRDNFMEEMADVIIRVLDCAAPFGNIEQAVADKLEKNESRGYRHGGKKV